MGRNSWITILILFFLGSVSAQNKDQFTLGKIGLGQGSAKVLRVLGPPAQKGELVEEPATGEIVERWSYPDLGLEIDMSSAQEKTGLTVYRIYAEEPCDFRGYRGVNIGAFAVEIQALARELERDSKVEVSRSEESYGFLWTEEYQMLSLTLENGKISEIYLGPGPE